jgi:hypothetical protein
MELWEIVDFIACVLIATTFPIWVKVLFDYLDKGESNLILQFLAVLLPVLGFPTLGWASQIQCNGGCQFYPEEPSNFIWLAFLSAGVSALVFLFGFIWKFFFK